MVLSFSAALGFSAVVFQYVFDINGADTGLPLFAFVFLVALGIDYNIFLMTRVREEARRRGSRRGALIGLAATGGVDTAAGLVLAGTFGTLATLPLTFTLQIGFVVAFGVLLDTIIVRSILVTGLNLDLGRTHLVAGPNQPARTQDQFTRTRRNQGTRNRPRGLASLSGDSGGTMVRPGSVGGASDEFEPLEAEVLGDIAYTAGSGKSVRFAPALDDLSISTAGLRLGKRDTSSGSTATTIGSRPGQGPPMG